MAFHLIEVEAYRIGDSQPAPFFSVVVRPSEEGKEVLV